MRITAPFAPDPGRVLDSWQKLCDVVGERPDLPASLETQLRRTEVPIQQIMAELSEDQMELLAILAAFGLAELAMVVARRAIRKPPRH